jgi:hypothetical protein
MAEKDYLSMLPTEIWQLIFQNSILLPNLDPDYLVDRLPPSIISNKTRSDTIVCYKTEARLNTLRRVCRSWDEYLRQYAHRFVRMLDVVHGNVPVHYLQSAIRISFRDHDDVLCAVCQPENFQLDEAISQYIELCQHIIVHKKPFRAQIIDYGHFGHRILHNIVSSGTFPNLIRIHATQVSMPASEIIQTIESLPTLRHMYAQLMWNQDRILSLRSTTLITLMISFHIPNPSFTMFTDETLHLPALRHLHINYSYYDHPGAYGEPAWLALVRVVGKQLRTLVFSREAPCTMNNVPEEIWRICPKLEDLFAFGLITIPAPPAGHPIHTLNWAMHRDNDVPDWPSLRTIRMDRAWSNWFELDDPPLTTSQVERLKSRFVLQDRWGESYAEYISRLCRGSSES